MAPDDDDIDRPPPAEDRGAAPVASEASDASGAPGAAYDGDSLPVTFPVIAIGASAGGVEALEKLVARLTIDGLAFVVMQHLAPDRDSFLRTILSRSTPLRVVTIADGAKIERNVVFVAPPNGEVTVEADGFRVRSRNDAVHRTIDVFFRSLADSVGPLAIGVLLSGAGSDGTAGLGAIKAAGGITFVQDPATASQPSMPRSALDAGAADFCLPPAEIGDELMRLRSHPYVARAKQRFDEELLRRVFDRLRRAYDVDFGGYKRSTIERRMERRMALQKLVAPEDYLRLLQSSPGELGVLYSDLLISVTAFFRDREPFDVLASAIFPAIVEAHRPDRPIRIWIAGCATGEEAYSIAICLLEHLGDRAPLYDVQIFGTDIDDRALNVARAGIYPSSIEQDVSPDRLARFFAPHERGYQVARHVRDLVVFARHNLGKDPPFSRLDLVSCRNVLIYMQPPLQRRIFRIFHHALGPNGYLLLGGSETVGEAADLFAMLDRTRKIYQRKNVSSPVVFDFRSGGRDEPHDSPPARADHRPGLSVQQLADRKVIEKYGPPGVLLDEALAVIQFRGHTGPFLSPAPGTASFSVFKLARPELLVELRAAIRAATQQGVPFTSAPVPLHDGAQSSVLIDVVPVQDSVAKRKCLLVSFRRAGASGAGARGDEPAPRERPRTDDPTFELERELLLTKEYLQTAVHELETFNEELQSSNEELQSANEELQSSNEELETSKEELQSSNEELATVNDELQSRMAQLAVANNDLENILSMSSTATVIVGHDLRIRRFSRAAQKLLDLIAADVGRPIGYLSVVTGAPQTERMIIEAIKTITPAEQRVRCSDGRWYTMRMSPYRTSDDAIRGAVVELVRAPEARRAGEPAEIDELVAKVLAALPHQLVLLDDHLRIVWMNRAAYQAFELDGAALGQALDQVWPVRGEQPALWARLEEASTAGVGFDAVRVSVALGRQSARAMRVSARTMPGERERKTMLLLMIEYVTDEH